MRENGYQEVKDSASNDPLRVLCLDGGGMRGVYTAEYLSCVASSYARRRSVAALDIGAAFNLITGTSTGAILACALAAGISLKEVVELYTENGKKIFPKKLPNSFSLGLLWDLWRRPKYLKKGEEALRTALKDCFQEYTLGQVYEERSIGLAIPAVNLANHRSWVFKTPHLSTKTNHRDDDYLLVDICLATTAAPLFRSLAYIEHSAGLAENTVFADGGLWANNPVLVGLIDALEMAAPQQSIEIYCLGTCPIPAGEDTSGINRHRSLMEWKFGGEAAKLAIDAQEFAYSNMAVMLSHHLDRKCTIIRFPTDRVPAALLKYLDLDETSDAAAKSLINQARSDANMLNSRCGDPNDAEGCLINSLFMEMPIRKEPTPKEA